MWYFGHEQLGFHSNGTSLNEFPFYCGVWIDNGGRLGTNKGCCHLPVQKSAESSHV